MPDSIEYASFLVRMWRADDAEAVPSGCLWRGEVQHIQSGQEWRFDSLKELLGFLRYGTEEPNLFFRLAARG
jgi:hypothetical protein